MRVLHLSSYFPGLHPYWGGAERACQRVMEVLMVHGDAACALATTPVGQQAELPFPHFSIETLSNRDHGQYWPFLRHYWLQKDPVVYSQTKAVLDAWRPDVVHFHNFNVMTFSALNAVVAHRIACVLSIYDYWIFCPTDMLVDRRVRLCSRGHGLHCLFTCLRPHFFRPWHLLANLPIFTRKTYFQRHLRKFGRIIALSNNSKQVMHRYSPDPLQVDVVPLPLAAGAEKRPLQTGDAPVIMHAGWVQARKGPHIVIQAMREVIAQIPDAHLNIVGALSESRYESTIRNLIKELGLEKHVTVTGKLPQDEFEHLFRQASVITVAEQWFNMSPVFLLEAMAAGKAIVAGAIGGIPEYVRDEKEALLCTYNDPLGYARQIIRLLKDGDMRRRLGRSAADRVHALCQPEDIHERLLMSYMMSMKTERGR